MKILSVFDNNCAFVINSCPLFKSLVLMQYFSNNGNESVPLYLSFGFDIILLTSVQNFISSFDLMVCLNCIHAVTIELITK